MTQSKANQRSGNVCISCLVLHIAIVTALVIGFDVWIVWSVWFSKG